MSENARTKGPDKCQSEFDCKHNPLVIKDEVVPDGKCIFHTEYGKKKVKITKGENGEVLGVEALGKGDEKIKEAFKEKFVEWLGGRYLNVEGNLPARIISINGFIFPEYTDEEWLSIWTDGLGSETDLTNSIAEFDIKFSKFTGDFVLPKAVANQVIIRDCIFAGGLNGCYLFVTEEYSLKRCIWGQAANFFELDKTKEEPSQSISFWECTFIGTASFAGAHLKSLSFYDCTIKQNADFSKVYIPNKLLFKETIFEGGVSLGQAVIDGSLIAVKSKFKEGLSAAGAKFSTQDQRTEKHSNEKFAPAVALGIKDCDFFGKADFSKIEADGDVEIIGNFPDQATGLNPDAYKTAVEVNDKSPFPKCCVFRKGFSFSNAKLKKVNLKDIAVNDQAYFGFAELEERNEISFSYFDLISFHNSIFHGDASLHHTRFERGADFSSVKFIKTADFNNVRFAGGSNFMRSIFNGSVYFRYLTFEKENYFGLAFLNDFTQFENISILGTLKFHTVVFRKVLMKIVKIGKDASLYFTECEFNNNFKFKKVSSLAKGSECGKMIFLDSNLSENGFLSFEDCDLRQASFWLTNLYLGSISADFVRCIWRKENSTKILDDDYLITGEKEEDFEKKRNFGFLPTWPGGAKPDLEELERQYRQVRAAIENRGDFLGAGDFFAREMEVRGRRLNLAAISGGKDSPVYAKLSDPKEKEIDGVDEEGWLLRLKLYLRDPKLSEKTHYFLHLVYGWLAKYGESPARILGRAFCLTAILSVAVLFGGFNVISTGHKPEGQGACQEAVSTFAPSEKCVKMVNYDLTIDLEEFPEFGEVTDDLGNALGLTVNSMTLFRTGDYSAAGGGGVEGRGLPRPSTRPDPAGVVRHLAPAAVPADVG